MRLFNSPADIVQARWLRALARAAKLLRLWEYPVNASGSLEFMTTRDKVYWVHKANHRIVTAWPGSGLEQFFETQARHVWTLPRDFVARRQCRFVAAGDLLGHPFLANSKDSLYGDVADDLFAADISMANLECVISSSRNSEFVIRSSASAMLCFSFAEFAVIVGHGNRRFTALATANNHSLDDGERGVRSTLAALNSEGVSSHGMNEFGDDAEQALVLERNGVRFGIVSHTFGLNANEPPADKPWLVNRSNLNAERGPVDFSHLVRQMADGRARGADIIVAQLHWGWEHEYYPRPVQLTVARALAELGADVIVGHHPHVTQPMECYRTQRDPARVVPIFYSLGNLVNPFSHPEFRRGALARCEFVKGLAADGSERTYVAHADMLDLFQEIDEVRRTVRLVRAGGRRVYER